MTRAGTRSAEGDAMRLVLLILGSVFAGVGTLLFVIFTAVGGPFWDDLVLDARGVSVEAVVLDTRNTGIGAGYRRYWYDARVEYRIGSRAPVHSTVRTRGFVAQGATLHLEVDPDDPSRFRRRGRSASLFGAFVLLPLGAALVGFGMLAAWFSMRPSRRLS